MTELSEIRQPQSASKHLQATIIIISENIILTERNKMFLCVFLMVQASARAQSKPSNFGAPARPVNSSTVIQPRRTVSQAVFPRTQNAFERVQTILLPARLQQRTQEKRERQTLQQETRQDATGRVCKRPPAADINCSGGTQNSAKRSLGSVVFRDQGASKIAAFTAAP